MAIHKLFTKILLIQTYHTTCVSFSCEFRSGASPLTSASSVPYNTQYKEYGSGASPLTSASSVPYNTQYKEYRSGASPLTSASSVPYNTQYKEYRSGASPLTSASSVPYNTQYKEYRSGASPLTSASSVPYNTQYKEYRSGASPLTSASSAPRFQGPINAFLPPSSHQRAIKAEEAELMFTLKQVIEIQLFGLRRTNKKKLFLSLPKAEMTKVRRLPQMKHVVWPT